jgi:hypothetical protein
MSGQVRHNRAALVRRSGGDYEASVAVLAEELSRVEQVFRKLTPHEWATPTRLVPVDPSLPHWTVFELAGHFDIREDH